MTESRQAFEVVAQETLFQVINLLSSDVFISIINSRFSLINSFTNFLLH